MPGPESPLPPSSWKVALRIAVPFLVFVVAGSIGLGEWFQANFRRENQRLFVTLATTNADFIRRSHLPHSRQMAEDLSRILGLQVSFRSKSGATVPPLQPAPDSETIAIPLDSESDLLLVRKPARDESGLFRPATLLAFGVFWALTLALAAALTRGVVRPYLAALVELGAERAAREKAERLALLGKMATGLAHEIHNPLSAIRMHLQLLAHAEPAESVAIALAEIAKIETLVNQWMFLVRPAPPQTSPTGLADLVHGVARTLQPLAEHARVRLSVEIPAALRVSADARRISQAVGNIAINGIRPCPREASSASPPAPPGASPPSNFRMPAAAFRRRPCNITPICSSPRKKAAWALASAWPRKS